VSIERRVTVVRGHIYMNTRLYICLCLVISVGVGIGLGGRRGDVLSDLVFSILDLSGVTVARVRVGIRIRV
jgi:hypothetical protein